ncbi:hypothetical protein [Parasphingorhabdus sp.]|uniref:hypothetical protein n=1 Tax=Parasphingorhabdus sp. TaxID=2709688 RepID=UPI003001A3E6
MLDLLLALALSGASDLPRDDLATAMPANFSKLEMAKFRKPMTFNERHEREAERIAKAANCALPVVSRWVFAKMHAAMLVSENGEILKIIPVENGCPELEQYTVNHIAKYGSKIAPIPTSREPQWYRTTMNFRWPE